MPTVRILKQHVQVPFALLALVETALLFGSVYAGAAIRFYGDLGDAHSYMGELLPRAFIFASLMLIGLSSMGLYQAQQTQQLQSVYLRIFLGLTLGWLALTVLFYIFPDLYSGRGAIGLAVVVAAVVIGIERPLFYWLVDDRLFKRRALVLGVGDNAKQVLECARQSAVGSELVGFVSVSGEAVKVPEQMVRGIKSGRLQQFCRRARIQELILAVDDRRKSISMKDLLDCKLSGTRVVEQLSYIEREMGRVSLDLLYPGWLVFCDGCNRGTVRMTVKRTFDIVASSAVMLASAPLMFLTILAIKLEEGMSAPVFYRQKRVGEGGTEFEVLKFRSMRTDAENDGKAVWAQKGDSRVTKTGSIIRKTRIDELPQLLNVLQGEMSFVGPRPERPEFVQQLEKEIPYYAERHFIKPGITGWAQIRYSYGASIGDAKAKLEYDLYYVKNHSLLLDLYVLLSTAEVVMFGKGQ